MKYKTCTQCGETKERTVINFNRQSAAKDGLTTSCKECTNKKNRQDYVPVIKQKKKSKTKKISLDQFDIGNNFKVIEKVRSGERVFKGEVIYNDKRFMILKNHMGIRETFLKNDFITGSYRYEKISG